jgi:dienelactone hydrolase
MRNIRAGVSVTIRSANAELRNAMIEKKVSYEVNGRSFEGMIVYDETVTGKRPAIYMQPDWKGVSPAGIGQARTVAGKDYVVLMADMFGAGYGAKPKSQDELRAGMLAVHKDLAFTLSCGKTAYHALLDAANGLGLIDTDKVVAIGYCAGGGYALEQARAGAPFKALVVFHVTNPNPVVPGTPCNIKGRVLALHGADDPITPKSKMDAFEQEMTDAKVDWQVMMFGGAVHSFCDVGVNTDAQRYDEKLCRKSYAMMRDFFAETL